MDRICNSISSRLFFFVFVILLFSASSVEILRSEAAKLPDDEVAALKIIGSKLEKTGWDFSVDPCSGSGGFITSGDSSKNNVTCDCTYENGTICHIVSINLKEQNLAGVLPEEMSKLTHLKRLDLAPNYLGGTIPAAWASLPLEAVIISVNRISGQIPKEFGNITTLQRLSIEGNLLEGPLPPELGNLHNMQTMFLNANNFTGPLPQTLEKLTNLDQFRISGSNFTGKIPDFIRNWTKLTRLMIMGTNMEGPIPNSISALENMTDLRISDLKGVNWRFPPLDTMKKLQKLILRNCKLSGAIPPYIWSLEKLRELDLSFNSLTGRIPSSLPINGTLKVVFLGNNHLSGTVPDWIYSSENNWDLSGNGFIGSAASESCPQGTVNLVSSFVSTDNSIPACYRKHYPCHGVANYTSLFINCGGAAIGDEYEEDSTQLGTSTYHLSVRGNWALISSGTFMDDSSLPYIVQNTSRLSISDPTLYMTARTTPMAMTYYGLCLQSGKYAVTLHFAEIMFTDDGTFRSLGERVFDVSIQNEIVLPNFNIAKEAGGIGMEVVKSFTASVSENTLEISFYWAGKGTLNVPARGVYGPLVSAISVTPYVEPKADERKTPVTIIAVIVSSVCVVVFLTAIVLWKKDCFGCREAQEKGIEDLKAQTHCFSLKQIKKATKDFHRENKIGEGGFGPVYRGTLGDGTLIAVKQLSSRSRQGNREFLNEIGMISALQHPNLVKLFGCCIEGNQLMLIYEYMENNSLAHALFGPFEHRMNLDWPTRHKICIGTAKGLAYLHEESTLKIVHRDIKATNILLDKALNPKISDFGLAKLDEGDGTHISTRIAGTVGYMAPEYATRGYLTDKADVYSFGVVAFEIVSGQNNANAMNMGDYVDLPDWALALQQNGSLLDMVDPSLGSSFPHGEVLRMIDIALLCTSPLPSRRPAMSSIVDMLEGRIPVQAPSLSSTMKKSPLSSAQRTSNPHSRTTTQTSVSYSGQSSSGYGPSTSSSDSFVNTSERMWERPVRCEP